jgi:hypothetical protein
VAYSYHSRPNDSETYGFSIWVYGGLILVAVIIIAVSTFFIGYHHGKSSMGNVSQTVPSASIALKDLPKNSNINTGNLNLTGQLISISDLHSLVVETLSGNNYTLTVDSQTTVLKNNKLVALSSVKIGAILTINAVTQRDGSLTPLRIIVIK